MRSFRLATLVALALLLGVASVQHGSVAAIPTALDGSTQRRIPILDARHGDHEHEDEMEMDEHEHKHEHEDAHSHSDLPAAAQAEEPSIPHLHSEKPSHSGGTHGHHHHQHATPHVPSIEEIADAPFIIPYITGAHTGGHSHGNSNAPPELVLNETNLLLNKGPEPLSYLEWDFNYGLGARDALVHLTSKAFQDKAAGTEYGVMGVVDGRYRMLLDEVNAAQRDAVTQDIASRVQDSEPSRHKWLMVMHIVGASVSCFVLLPLALFLRAASSTLAPLSSLVYLASLTGSLLLSSLYKALTPRLYPANAHSGLGWAILWISVICLGSDVFRLLGQMYAAFKTSRSPRLALRELISGTSSEKYSAVEEEEMLNPDTPSDRYSPASESHPRSASPRVHFEVTPRASGDWHGSGSAHDGSASPTSTLIGSQIRKGSLTEAIATKFPWRRSNSANDSHVASWTRDTTAASAIKPRRSRVTVLKNVIHYTHVVVSRALPVLSFAGAYTGLAVYTGSCRQPYKNVCLAHGIKGGIFFWYGLLTFGRYLGAYADCGWAWNRRPSPESAGKRRSWKANMPSAEWVECVIIFTYGATNTWMERFSAQPGDPYTVKQVQHISIAVMYWFAGALGVLLETRWVRNLLNVPVALHHPSAREVRRGQTNEADQEPIVAAQAAPPSYSGSFNPFPALCVGVTGIAMAAHHQDYLYEVKIHELWGQMLAGFAVLRCMTYVFLWLRPPMSILPSRPPTEALASFSLTAGGLVFMLSSEEVSFAAMRNGFDDFMAIMCITVAIICFIFALIAALMITKAWAVRREMQRVEMRAASATGADAHRHRPRAHVDHDADAEAEAVSTFVLGGEEEEDEDHHRDAQAGANTDTTTTRPARHLAASPDAMA